MKVLRIPINEKKDIMQLTNEWISGFIDGEGCFNVQKIKNKKEGIQGKSFLRGLLGEKTLVRHRFSISLDKKSVNVLYGIKLKLKCGSVHKAGGERMCFQVSKKSDLENNIIPFFQKYELKTTKRETFRFFVESLENINEKGYEQQLMLMERGKDCKGDKKSEKKENTLYYNFSDNWFRGFIDAQGCFSVSLVKDYPRVSLIIGLQSKEKQLLAELKKFLKCGTLRTRKDGVEILQISTSKDLERYIFPKLQTKGGAVLLQSNKRISYQKFRKIVRLITDKKHHTVQGLEKIRKYKDCVYKQGI